MKLITYENGVYLEITRSGINRMKSLEDKFWNGKRLADDEVKLLPLLQIYYDALNKKYSDELFHEVIKELKERFPDGLDDPEIYIRLGYVKWN